MTPITAQEWSVNNIVGQNLMYWLHVEYAHDQDSMSKIYEVMELYATQIIDQLKAKHKEDVIKAVNYDRPNLLVWTSGEAAEQYYIDNHENKEKQMLDQLKTKHKEDVIEAYKNGILEEKLRRTDNFMSPYIAIDPLQYYIDKFNK